MSENYVERAKQIDLNNRAMFKAAPDAMQGYVGMIKAVNSDGALDTKTKELMALSIAVALHCEDCLIFHARAAHREAASREEVAEAISVAIQMGGGPAAVYGGKALAAFDQFAAA